MLGSQPSIKSPFMTKKSSSPFRFEWHHWRSAIHGTFSPSQSGNTVVVVVVVVVVAVCDNHVLCLQRRVRSSRLIK